MERVYKAEAICAGLILAITGAALVLAQTRGVRIDYASFAGRYLLAAAMLGIATLYRRRDRAPRISLTLVSSALFVLFTNGGAVLNYTLIPRGAVPIDPLLIRIDAALGFDWANFAELVSRLDGAGTVLGYVYQSSLFQFALLILLLGFGGHRLALHRFMLVGMLCSLVCMAIWSLAPSVGPGATLFPAVELRLHRILAADYTRQMLALLRDGPGTVSAKSLIGLISFPSMHTVMAAMSVAYSRRTLGFWPLMALNALMVPAILIHGQHHFADVLGGLALFAIVAVWVRHLIPDEDQVQTASGGWLIRPIPPLAVDS